MSKKVTREIKEIIEELYQLGYSYKEISEIVGLSPSTTYKYILLRRKGVDSNVTYADYFAREKGFKSYKEYKTYLARKNGYESYGLYLIDQDFERSKRNRKLGNLIKERLETLEKNPKWLARKLGVSRRTVYQYLEGTRFPSKEILPSLFEILGLPYQILEEISEE